MIRVLMGMKRKESLRSMLLRLHRDERGAEGLEKLLIFAAVILPLLGLLIFFGEDIKEWVAKMWNTIKGEGAALEENKPTLDDI